MKIHFERSGGFMGKSIHATVDTSTLPDPEAEALEEMLSEATFFALPAADEAEPQAPGIDQMTYTVTVIAGEEAHTICMTDTEMPEALRPLLRKLTLLARRPGVTDQAEETDSSR